MSNHVTEWLNAYHDGELHGNRLRHVQAHLAGCEVCQAELESLHSLSDLLHEVETPELVSTERFAAQVSLRLPREQAALTPGKKVTEIGWWMIPVGLLAAWVFVSTAFVLGDILSVAGDLGLLSGMSAWLASGPSSDIYLSATLGQAGFLSGNGLNWAEAAETLTRSSLPQISVQISIVLLYLGWMAIWWARHTRRRSEQLLEG
jgi:predicted anti-sigma-YlaC factor YlaD